MSYRLEDRIIGQSLQMRRLRALVTTAAPTRLPVLIVGPTGSGKELVAEALHRLSGRTGAFVPFNACAIGETMFEDALFGHVKGAFTGAIHDTLGYLREANGGTAFMDEITGLPLALQAKLLRAIETGEFRPIGARRDATSEFRVVAATNEPLEELVTAQRFRADLAHRVGGVVIAVPPLASRLEDLPGLVRHFLARSGLSPDAIGSRAIDVLEQSAWHGNVRELKQVVEWAAVIGEGNLSVESVSEALSQRLRLDGHALGSPAATTCPGPRDVVFERRELLDSMRANDWNADRAAETLGIHRATLYRRLKRCGIEVASVGAGAPLNLREA